MTLNDTAALMKSDNYKDRFAAEYYQLAESYAGQLGCGYVGVHPDLPQEHLQHPDPSNGGIPCRP